MTSAPMNNERNPNDYDSEPVKYCARCYSLKVKYEDAIDSECCAECGSSDIVEDSVYVWERKFEQRYGHKFIVKNDDPRKSYIFKLPISKLKQKVCDCPSWRELIHRLYSKFPGGLGKADSIILFFDKLYQDNRIDDLRMLLLKLKL